MTPDRPPGPIRWEPLTKPGGGTRAIAHLDPRDAAVYRRLVLPFVGPVERRQGPGAFANRTDRWGRLMPVPPARRRWRRAVEDALLAQPGAAVVASDVRDCYASIDPRALRRSGIDEPDLLGFLERLESAGVRGIPVGPAPSAILANAVLAVADRAVERTCGVVPIRWVDDVLFIGAEGSVALRAFDAWCRALTRLGLEPNETKTVHASRGDALAAALGRAASLDLARSRAIIGSP